MKTQQFRKFLSKEGTNAVSVKTSIHEDKTYDVSLHITDENNTIYLDLFNFEGTQDTTDEVQQFIILRDAIDFALKFLDKR